MPSISTILLNLVRQYVLCVQQLSNIQYTCKAKQDNHSHTTKKHLVFLRHLN